MLKELMYFFSSDVVELEFLPGDEPIWYIIINLKRFLETLTPRKRQNQVTWELWWHFDTLIMKVFYLKWNFVITCLKFGEKNNYKNPNIYHVVVELVGIHC